MTENQAKAAVEGYGVCAVDHPGSCGPCFCHSLVTVTADMYGNFGGRSTGKTAVGAPTQADCAWRKLLEVERSSFAARRESWIAETQRQIRSLMRKWSLA